MGFSLIHGKIAEDSFSRRLVGTSLHSTSVSRPVADPLPLGDRHRRKFPQFATEQGVGNDPVVAELGTAQKNYRYFKILDPANPHN